MTNIVFNKNVVAFPSRVMAPSGSILIDPYKQYGTPYGMFIPISATGTHLIRWIRRDMKDELPPDCLSCYSLHISNDGEVLLLEAFSIEDSIAMVQYTSDKFSMICTKREVAEAYTYLISDCKTVAEAVEFVDQHEVNGLHNPTIFFVDDWVSYAREKGYDKIFYLTEFPKKPPAPVAT